MYLKSTTLRMGRGRVRWVWVWWVWRVGEACVVGVLLNSTTLRGTTPAQRSRPAGQPPCSLLRQGYTGGGMGGGTDRSAVTSASS